MIESLLGVLFALGVAMAAGMGALLLLARGASPQDVGSWPERLALIWLLGVGYVSLALFTCGFVLLGAPLIGAVTIGAVALFATGRHLNRGTASKRPRDPLKRTEWVLVAVILLQVFVVFWTVTEFPLGWDGLTIWDMKAQIAFSNDGRLPSEYFRDTTRSWSHVHYPLNLPYAETWLYLCLGRVDQSWVRGIGALFYLAAIGLLAGAVPRLGGTRLSGLIVAACLFFLPMLTAMPSGVFSGYADFPLGVIYLAAVCRLPFWRAEPCRIDDRLLAVLAVLAVWTKTEGKVLFGVLLVSTALVVVSQRQWRRLVVVGLPTVVLLVCYGIYLRHVNALPDRNYSSPTPSNVFAHLDRVGPIARSIGAQFVALKNWSLLWPGALLAIVTLASAGKRLTALHLSILLALPLSGYALAYILSTWPNYERHIHTSLSRLLLGLAPAALLAIGLAIPRFSRPPPTR